MSGMVFGLAALNYLTPNEYLEKIRERDREKRNN